VNLDPDGVGYGFEAVGSKDSVDQIDIPNARLRVVLDSTVIQTDGHLELGPQANQEGRFELILGDPEILK